MTDRLHQYKLSTLPANDASFGYTYPVAQYDHDEGVALCGGYVYRGHRPFPHSQGQYLFGDIFTGACSRRLWRRSGPGRRRRSRR